MIDTKERMPNEYRVLKNRLRVIYTRLPNCPQVSMHVAVRSGAIYEDARENGVSHLLEHLHAKQASSGDAIRTQATFSAWMDMDVAHFSVTVAKSLASEAAKQLAGSLGPINLDVPHFEREKNVVVEEVEPFKGRDFLSAIYGRLYSGTPFGMPIGGRQKSVRRLTLQAAISYDRRFYQGRCMAVGIAGTLEQDEVESLIEVFKNIQNIQESPVPVTASNCPTAQCRQVFSWETARHECVLAFSLPHSVSYDESLCLRILSRSCSLVSSPIYKILREENSFHDFDGRVHFLGETSTFIVRCEASRARQLAAAKGIAKGIAGITVDSTETDAWLVDAKTFFAHLSDPDSIPSYDTSYWSAYPVVSSSRDRYFDLKTEAETARGISNKAILEAARKYLNIDSLSIFVDGPWYPGRRWSYFHNLEAVL